MLSSAFDRHLRLAQGQRLARWWEPRGIASRLTNMSISPDFFTSRRRALLVGAIVLVAIPTACGGSSDVDVREASISDNGMMLSVGVATCNEASTQIAIEETSEAVVVTATTRASYGCGGQDDCQDQRTAELADPLGDRIIVDSNGAEIERPDG